MDTIVSLRRALLTTHMLVACLAGCASTETQAPAQQPPGPAADTASGGTGDATATAEQAAAAYAERNWPEAERLYVQLTRDLPGEVEPLTERAHGLGTVARFAQGQSTSGRRTAPPLALP